MFNYDYIYIQIEQDIRELNLIKATQRLNTIHGGKKQSSI